MACNDVRSGLVFLSASALVTTFGESLGHHSTSQSIEKKLGDQGLIVLYAVPWPPRLGTFFIPATA